MHEPPKLPPIATAPLSVLLPAHNAAAWLDEVLGGWTAYLDTLNRDYEILLVDDGSKDETEARADAAARADPRLVVLRHPIRLGYGACLRTGLSVARHPLLCTATCDRQYRPDDLARLLEPLDQVHFVTGLRVWQEKPLWARVLGWCHRALIRVLFGVTLDPVPGWLGSEGRGRRLLARWGFGVRVHDVDCAFRVFRREVFARIPIQSDSAFALVEVLAKANFLGLWMAQAQVRWAPPDAGSSAVDQHERDRARVEARRLFRDPDFGPPELPTPPPAPASESPAPPAAEGPLPSPTA